MVEKIIVDPEAKYHDPDCDRKHDHGEFCPGLIMEAPPLKETILQEAERIINGERRDDYGTATFSFQRIAGLWSSYLDVPIAAHDVAMCMVLLKVARAKQGIDSVGNPQRDSLVDIAGYAGCSDKIIHGL